MKKVTIHTPTVHLQALELTDKPTPGLSVVSAGKGALVILAKPGATLAGYVDSAKGKAIAASGRAQDVTWWKREGHRLVPQK